MGYGGGEAACGCHEGPTGQMPSVKKQTARAGKTTPIKRRDRDRTRQEILDIAFAEFAENGLSGGNTDAIAARANITKRLIFYYFNSKEELFTAVLEMAYAKMRAAEEDLHLEALEPEAAIRRLVEFTFDFHHANPEFVRLVSIENIHRGRHIGASQRLKEMTQPSISQIAKLLARGVASGAIRPGVDPIELHMTLNALSFFSVANRHTFEAQFAWDMSSPKAKAQRRSEIADLLWRYLRKV
ncbi:TetR family transcriptional regulator [Bradyrhizobium daqingense]|uniref:TetR family transcriptional regulator n=1 Tax=Bradyrhizobium daqingense TaxID=993502 RepID=A0A562L4P0_9BRAD|nr:TetR family transcriptional regulator [Bradyrhizobium daqingense]TWI02608.1 TetR family transcriptional regulator [Bradyrhizobium daqingense]UFS91072.1 TetR family transcriptional regulator [Bradyrhizobium daqingense]